MTTVVNNPPSGGDSGSGMGVIVGVILVIVVVLLIIFFGIPMMRDVQAPATPNQGNTINVPDKIDVNVNKTTP